MVKKSILESLKPEPKPCQQSSQRNGQKTGYGTRGTSSTQNYLCVINALLDTALAAAVSKATVYDVPASPESDWQNFPHDLMMFVVAELFTKAVTALMTSCNQWRVQLSTVIEKARLSRLPMFSSNVTTSQRKSSCCVIAK